jgi:flavorubredoxin
MGAIKLTSDVYSVGVLNPNMRIFDVIMKTEYGTSYNAYLIRSDKNVLIETVHPRFYDEYLENIASVIDPTKIDYIVMNHNEPDHSGSLAKLMEVAPQLKVIASPAGAIYLKHITNIPGLKVHVAKDGETLDLGQGKTLQFISAPFLHWPDSMFTWLASEKTVFTCDFLGAHFCEPRMIDSRITYPRRYETAFEGYFNAIFAPFRSYVLKGLEKLDRLDAQTVCTSHGPVLTAGCCLETAKKKYLEWSTPVEHKHKQVPLFYCSAYSNTQRIAEKIAEGIRSVLPDAQTEIYDINEHPMAELAHLLNESDGFLLGSPTINKDAVLPVWTLACSIDAYHTKGKKCSAFGSFGWSGEAVPMLLERLRSLKLDVFEDGFTCRFIPSGQELSDAFDFGKRFAAQL